MMRIPAACSSIVVLAALSGCGDGTSSSEATDVVSDGLDAAPPAPRLGTWSIAATLTEARAGHSATRLDDDRIVVAGGTAGVCPTDSGASLASVEIVAPDGQVSAARPMNVARRFHAATRLASGHVLVAGGLGSGDAEHASAEVYDEVTDTWSVVGSMSRAHRWMTLVAWGESGALALSDDGTGPVVELFRLDGEVGTWSPGPTLPGSLVTVTPVALPDGRVLLVGREASAIVAADGSALTLISQGIETDTPAAALGTGGVVVVARAPTGAFTEAGPVHASLVFRWVPENQYAWGLVGIAPFGELAFELVAAPDGAVFGRAGWGGWHRFVDDVWEPLAFTNSVQQGVLVPLADGSLRLVAGSGDPTCAAVATVLAWEP